MESYSDSRGERFKSTSLARYGRYYGLAVPDQIMQFGQVDGVKYTFNGMAILLVLEKNDLKSWPVM